MTVPAVAIKGHVDGTHRVVEPWQTLERLRPCLAQIGVTRVAVITGLDAIGIPVVMVCRPNGRSLSVSQGKGIDLVSAKVSGIMEALEAWHAEQILTPLRLATYRELRAVARVVDIDRLPRMSWSRFHPDLSILWIEGTDVISAERVWVPYECVHLDFRSPGPQGTGCFLSTSSGLAAGNHLLEAVSHALCEVIERDALALWVARSPLDQASRHVDLDTVTDPGCRALLGAYEAAGVGVMADDLTTDVDLPVFSVTIVDRDSRSNAATPGRERQRLPPRSCNCVRHALTEAAQSRLTLIAGSRDDMPPHYYRQLRDDDAIARYVDRLDRGPARVFTDIPDCAGASLEEDVALELDRLRAVGVEQAVLIDLTRPEVRVPVTRMVVPGMEGFADKVEGLVPGLRARELRGAW